MQCKNCGSTIQPGMSFCPECGTPVSQETSMPTVSSGQYNSGNPPPYEPTVLAQPYNSSQTPPPPANYEPTQYGTPSSYAPPPPNTYGAPQSGYYAATP